MGPLLVLEGLAAGPESENSGARAAPCAWGTVALVATACTRLRRTS